jgi:hypothetical protein
MPFCLFRAVTGLPCPGCGVTRALIAIARGDYRKAWRLNPAAFAVIVYFAAPRRARPAADRLLAASLLLVWLGRIST